MSRNIEVTIVGRVGTNPRLMESKTGNNYTMFRLAYSRSMRTETGKWVDLQNEWFTVKAWGNLATNIECSIHKGDPVIVCGRFETETWVKDGKEYQSTTIYASSVGIDFNWATAFVHPSKHILVALREAQEQAKQAAATQKASLAPSAENTDDVWAVKNDVPDEPVETETETDNAEQAPDREDGLEEPDLNVPVDISQCEILADIDPAYEILEGAELVSA